LALLNFFDCKEFLYQGTPSQEAKRSKVTIRYWNSRTPAAKTTDVAIVVHTALRHSAGMVGAPGSVPGLTEPLSSWLRTPHGNTANSTIHHSTK
jgi:hypothetical protein